MRRIVAEAAFMLAGAVVSIVYTWAAVAFLFTFGAPYVQAP